MQSHIAGVWYRGNVATLVHKRCRGARSGKPLSDGSIIVVAFSPAKLSPSGELEADLQGRLIGESPKSYSAMQVRGGAGDAMPELLRNGNWIYGLFDEQRMRIDKVNYAMCLACHKGVAASSYVFTLSQLMEQASAGK